MDILDIVFQRFSSTPPISINGFFPALRPFLPISELDKKFIRLLDFMREHIKGAILKLDIIDRPPLLTGFHATYEYCILSLKYRDRLKGGPQVW